MKIFTMRGLTTLLWLAMIDVGAVSAQDRKPIGLVQAVPFYPYEMSREGIGGRVAVEFTINTNGVAVDARAVKSTNRAFEMAAVQAVLKWRFKPGLKGGKAVAVHVTQILEFALDTAPVYPGELLRKGIAGRAVVEFSVDERGRAFDVRTVEATHPEFAGAARAAAVASTLAPAFVNSPAEATRQQREYHFRADGGGDVPISDETQKLLARLRKKPDIAKFSELDEAPKLKKNPGAKVAPDVRASIGGSGSAQVAVFIDASGNVVLPQVISATHEDLGYAAAQAVVDWKYSAPKKGGKSVPAQGIIEIAYESK